MSSFPLIEARQLAAHLGACVIVDCRFDLMDPEAGQRGYAAGHVPGSRYAHLERDLSGPKGPATGRHPLPDPDRLAACLGAWGISTKTSVVAYDAGSSAFAARLWWLLRWLGHESVSVLDGGYAAWERAGLPVERVQPSYGKAEYRVSHVHYDRVATSAEVAARASDRMRLVDVRTATRFAGAEEPIDPVAGHVPGAINYPFTESLGDDGRFLPVARLRRRLASVLGEDAPGGPVVAMCGSGVTACHLLLAMAAAGLPAGQLYAGSWSEWIAGRARPVATGIRSG